MGAIGMEHGVRSHLKNGLGSVAIAGLFITVVAGCDQPKAKCSVARGIFAATYTLVEGQGECAALPPELLGVQAYNARTSQSDDRPDYDKTSIGIQPQSITDLLGASAGLVEPDGADKPFALGRFSRSEPSSGSCEAPTLTTSRLRLPVIPEQEIDECNTAPEQAEVDVAYEFSNVKVVVTPENYGTKLEADLTYTYNGCVAKYRVAAVYPAHPCDAAIYPEPVETPIETDDNGDPICPPAPDSVEPEPSEDMCSPVAIPERGIAAGSGISPDFPVTCDPVLLHCVLK